MKDYYVVKFSEEFQEYSLVAVCGKDEEKANETLKFYQEKDPAGDYKLKSEESKKCWWNQGYLD